jgi:hypothetical protein
MKLNSKVTGGLAWAGLVLILAVPSADMLSKPSAWRADPGGAESSAATSGSEAAPKTATIKAPRPATRPAAPAAPATPAADGDPVESYVASGKKLPSYISDSPASTGAATEVAAAPAAPAAVKKIVVPSTPQTAAVSGNGTFVQATDEMTTASVETAPRTPPMPYPASMRPAGRTATAGEQPPLIIEEDPLTRRDVASQSSEPFFRSQAPAVIDGGELDEWDSGSLADYLERRGLISDSDGAVRTLERDFDDDGFFLSDRPNRSRARLIGRYRDGSDLF